MRGLIGHFVKHCVVDSIFARFCLECQAHLKGPTPWRYFCQDCAQAGFVRIEGPACGHCGCAFYGAIQGERTCPKCLELAPAFCAGKALLQFEGLGRTLVHGLKYREGRFLLPDIARCAQQSDDFRKFLQGAVLVPVPLHASKWRARGYNQSECVAKSWAKIASNAQVKNILIRCKPTTSQTGLTRKERFENVKNAFAICHKAVLIPEQKYILVDDVYTTGATLQACATTLAAAGAQVIHIATLCHG